MNGLTFKKLAANCTLIAACLTLAASPLMAANLATGFSGSAVPNSTVRFTGSLTDASGKTSSINVSTKASATGNYTLSSPVTNGADSMTGKIVYDTKIGSATQTNTLNFEWDRYTSSIRFYGTISPYGSVNLTTSGGEGTGAPIVAGAGGSFDTGDIVSTGFISGSTNVGLSITNTQYNCSPCVYTPASTTNLSYFVGLQSTGGSTGSGSANSGGGSGSGLGGALTNVAIGAAVAGLSSLLGGNNSKSNVAAVQDNSIDPLRAMTEEITNVMVDQSHIKAEAADADAQKDVALVTGEQTAELAIELTPSEAECDITSLHAASAPTLIHNTQAQEKAGTTVIGDYAIGAAGTTGALSAPQRTSFVADLVRASCNPADMGGMLTDFCEQTQIQLNPTALYGAQGPLDVDFEHGTGSQFDQVSALIDMMVEPLTLPTSDQLKRSRAERRRMGSEGTWLMNHKQDIASSLMQIMGSNIGTASENEPEMRALLEEMGLSQSQQDAFFTPDGKTSMDAHLEVLTHYYFLSPKFLANIQNSEAALTRIQGSLNAADLMLNTKIQEMMALKNRQITLFNAIDIRNESNERNRALTTVSNN